MVLCSDTCNSLKLWYHSIVDDYILTTPYFHSFRPAHPNLPLKRYKTMWIDKPLIDAVSSLGKLTWSFTRNSPFNLRVGNLTMWCLLYVMSTGSHVFYNIFSHMCCKMYHNVQWWKFHRIRYVINSLSLSDRVFSSVQLSSVQFSSVQFSSDQCTWSNSFVEWSEKECLLPTHWYSGFYL